jgi:alkylhydroperoxidase/carboxymuconolactone decarboxylase family protein YurZ
MSITAVPSSAVALIEKTLLAELNSATSTASTSNPAANPATTQLTKDFASLLTDLASGNVTTSKSAITKVQQDLTAQSVSATNSPLDNLLIQIAGSLNATNSTAGSLQDLAAYLIQNGQGTGSTVNTTA